MTADGVPGARPARIRFGALDFLRGLTIAAMIVVNNPGNWNSVFAPLQHSAWNGVTVADLIFPAFIFIMGVAMSFGFAGERDRRPSRPLYRGIVTRSALLVLLGLVLNAAAAAPDVATMRIPGVLQRIGLTYLFAALITLSATDAQQWAWSVALLLAHWAMLDLPDVFGWSGHLLPGDNVAAAIDRAVFGSHLLRPDGDPEGLPGTISSVATALFGASVGRWLIRDAIDRRASAMRGRRGPLLKLTVAGMIALGIGLLWSTVLPLNKALWTGSFAVLSCGVATLLLVICARLPATGAGQTFNPLLWLGRNPLAIYFLSELTSNVLQRPWLHSGGQTAAPKDWFFWSILAPVVRDGGGRLSSLLYALLYTAVWIAIAGALRWRGIRLRV